MSVFIEDQEKGRGARFMQGDAFWLMHDKKMFSVSGVRMRFGGLIELRRTILFFENDSQIL